ncbi:MAG: hypothetical protein OXI30_16990 [Chloroflexota bacterium]|nr:hypothetical protein [Chloroflexota bacterium]
MKLRRQSEAKPKGKPQHSGRRRTILFLLAGLLLIGAIKLADAVAFSVSQRGSTPEALIAGFPERYAKLMHNAFTLSSIEFRGPEVYHQERLFDLGAHLFLFEWRSRSDNHAELCITAAILAEAQDIFGGWYAKEEVFPICEYQVLDAKPPSVAFWEAQSEGKTTHYALVAGPAYRLADWVELELADGSVSRSERHRIAYAQVIRSDEPIEIERVRFLNSVGQSIASFTYPFWMEE